MATKLCLYCNELRDTRGFYVHTVRCKEKKRDEALRERYASQLKNMSPEVAERFLRKAQGG